MRVNSIEKTKPNSNSDSPRVVPLFPDQQLPPEEPVKKGKFTLFALYALELKLLRNAYFLLLFSLTIMNAFLFVYLARNDFPALDQQSADQAIQESFGKDFMYFSPVQEFLVETENYNEIIFSDFKAALKRLEENINHFGIFTGDSLSIKSFRFNQGGVHWRPIPVEGKTVYKPSAGRR